VRCSVRIFSGVVSALRLVKSPLILIDYYTTTLLRTAQHAEQVQAALAKGERSLAASLRTAAEASAAQWEQVWGQQRAALNSVTAAAAARAAALSEQLSAMAAAAAAQQSAAVSAQLQVQQQYTMHVVFT
jgi:hypothetical protein